MTIHDEPLADYYTEKNISVKEISEILGITRGFVTVVAKKAGILPRVARNKLAFHGENPVIYFYSINDVEKMRERIEKYK